MGRPRMTNSPVKRHTVVLTDEHVAIAKALGANISAGVRAALDMAANSGQVDAAKKLARLKSIIEQ